MARTPANKGKKLNIYKASSYKGGKKLNSGYITGFMSYPTAQRYIGTSVPLKTDGKRGGYTVSSNKPRYKGVDLKLKKVQ